MEKQKQKENYDILIYVQRNLSPRDSNELTARHSRCNDTLLCKLAKFQLLHCQSFNTN